MKLKRYILLLITLILAISFKTKNVYAGGTCYYTDDTQTTATIVTFKQSTYDAPPWMGTLCGYCEGHSSFYSADVIIEKFDGLGTPASGKNWEQTVGAGSTPSGISGHVSIRSWGVKDGSTGCESYDEQASLDVRATNIDIPKMTEAANYSGCPEYTVAKFIGKSAGKYYVTIYIATSLSDAQNALTDAKSQNPDYQPHILKRRTFEEYFGTESMGEVGEDIQLVCDASRAKNSLFGDPTFKGTDINNNGELDDNDTPPSMAYLIKNILGIMRIIAIAAVIVLGTVDMAKAVMAAKEENMKKAQNDFFKRVIACVVIFLIPTIVGAIMGISYNMWNDKGFHMCTYEQIVRSH